MRLVALVSVISIMSSLSVAAADFPHFEAQEIDPHAGKSATR